MALDVSSDPCVFGGILMLGMLQANRSEERIDKFLEIKISTGSYSRTQEIELPSKIGRSPRFEENTSLLALDNPYISREHLLVELDRSTIGSKRVPFSLPVKMFSIFRF